ncbi:RICIN domain-containing protein [Streptomyces sp. NPDC048514]|uniref:RICIN domain-containing protein n=1 Tax=Streptomyces sp. NPDC048514 TaxID=3365564 RepID=UPI003712679C
MQSPYPPRPPYPPLPGPTGESDRDLVARLGGPHIAHHHAVAVLLARHWRAARDYAVVCLTSAGPTAHLVATAAFHQVLGRLAGGATGGALRPRLLVAVRDIVRAWATDEGTCNTLPELRRTTGGRGLSATKPGTPERRQLAESAFHALPAASQCLLWHAEVEAEPINIPAGLLGIDAATAATALEQAREQFRAGCVRAHRELAPARECRFYNRLLDIPIRRGGVLLPEVRRHLTTCRHCRYAAEQLARFDGELGLLLAEAVLGWGARRYLDSRPGAGRGPGGPGPGGAGEGTARAGAEAEPVPPVPAGRHRTAPEGRRRTALAVGVGLTSLALLATVLAARSWSDDNGVSAPGPAWAAPAGGTTRPSGTTGPSGGGRPSGTGARPAASDPAASGSAASSAASVGEPVEVARGRLRALAARLCLDVRGNRIRAGAGLRLAACSPAASQQWSYRDDGLLRNAADPDLCLTADPAAKRVALEGCAVRGGEVSYDFTVRGEILLRRYEGLAMTPGSGDSVGGPSVEARDGSARQRWALEPDPAGHPRPGAAPGAPGGRGTGASRAPAGHAEEAPERGTPDGIPRGTPRGDDESPGTYDATPRFARARAETEPRRGSTSPALGDLVCAVRGRVAGAVRRGDVVVGAVRGGAMGSVRGDAMGSVRGLVGPGRHAPTSPGRHAPTLPGAGAGAAPVSPGAPPASTTPGEPLG